MLIEGTHAFPASRAVVWETLWDPDVIAKTTPGTRGMRRVGPDRYQGKMRLGLGPFVAAELDLTITLADVVPLQSYAMLIEGTGRHVSLQGRAAMRLADDPEGAGAGDGRRTTLRYAAEFHVGGTVTALGHRLIESVSRLVAKQGLEALSRELERRLKKRV